MYNPEDETLLAAAAQAFKKPLVSKNFISPDFLLTNQTGAVLYHEVAAGLPIIDYHNHLKACELAENKTFENITQLWITNDPYKHRAMRISGVPEHYITGPAPDKEKFLKWAAVLPYTLGNPLYHWSGLELKSVFGIDELLTPGTAEKIWHSCNEKLAGEGFGTLDILRKFKAEVTCTSDDLLDDLSFHQAATARATNHLILPSLRADNLVQVGQTAFSSEFNKLQKITTFKITDLETYQQAVQLRLDHFNNNGCLLADHALNAGFYFKLPSPKKAAVYFQKLRHSDSLTPEEQVLLQSYLLVFLGREYRRRGWVLQLHIGAQRATSSRLRTLVGPAGGYAAIGTSGDIASICRFLDALDQDNNLPKTILYTLNPADNETLTTLTGSFVEDGVTAKVQFGPAWWYNDHYSGIKKQLTALANYGLLPHFIGMTTDSRSVLSFSRHDYFRRILCNIIGKWAEAGHIPTDWAVLKPLIQNIAHNNARNWLKKP